MNCEQFQDVLQDLARFDLLDAAHVRVALEHADHCAACDRLLEQAENLSADLRSLASLDGSRQAPARLEQSLMTAFSQHKSRVQRPANLRWITAASVIGVAALAFFAAFLLRHGRQAGEAQAPSYTAPARPSPPLKSAPSSANVQYASAADFDSASDALAAFEKEAFEPERGSAGSFVPLTDMFDPSSLDGDAVVRVALSRADLAGWGLSASATDGRRVLADMIVTADGTPQAIRLVTER